MLQERSYRVYLLLDQDGTVAFKGVVYASSESGALHQACRTYGRGRYIVE